MVMELTNRVDLRVLRWCGYVVRDEQRMVKMVSMLIASEAGLRGRLRLPFMFDVIVAINLRGRVDDFLLFDC